MTPSEQERIAAAIWMEHRKRVAEIRSSPIDSHEPLVIPKSVCMARDLLADAYCQLSYPPADVPPLQDWTLPFRAEAADGTWWVVLSAKNVDLWMGKSESTAKAIAHALNAVYGKGKRT